MICSVYLAFVRVLVLLVYIFFWGNAKQGLCSPFDPSFFYIGRWFIVFCFFLLAIVHVVYCFVWTHSELYMYVLFKFVFLTRPNEGIWFVKRGVVVDRVRYLMSAIASLLWPSLFPCNNLVVSYFELHML